MTKFKISKTEKKKYLLLTDRDFKILQKIKQIEKFRDLTKEEKDYVNFIRTQLERDWRKYLIIKLDQIIKKRKMR